MMSERERESARERETERGRERGMHISVPAGADGRFTCRGYDTLRIHKDRVSIIERECTRWH